MRNSLMPIALLVLTLSGALSLPGQPASMRGRHP